MSANFRAMKQPSMNILAAITVVFVALSGLTSCASTEELKHDLEHRNERYFERQKRREMRQDARQERVDAWFDRVMH